MTAKPWDKLKKAQQKKLKNRAKALVKKGLNGR